MDKAQDAVGIQLSTLCFCNSVKFGVLVYETKELTYNRTHLIPLVGLRFVVGI